MCVLSLPNLHTSRFSNSLRSVQPYIAEAILGSENPPVQLAAVSLGNPTVGYFSEFEHATALTVIKTFPFLINYDPDVLKVFEAL